MQVFCRKSVESTKRNIALCCRRGLPVWKLHRFRLNIAGRRLQAVALQWSSPKPTCERMHQSLPCEREVARRQPSRRDCNRSTYSPNSSCEQTSSRTIPQSALRLTAPFHKGASDEVRSPMRICRKPLVIRLRPAGPMWASAPTKEKEPSRSPVLDHIPLKLSLTFSKKLLRLV